MDEEDETERRGVQIWGGNHRSRNWIDLDENVLDGYILMDDSCLESGVIPDETKELPYPEGGVEVDEEDADSHGKDDCSIYSIARRGVSRRGPRGEEFDLSSTYPLRTVTETLTKSRAVTRGTPSCTPSWLLRITWRGIGKKWVITPWLTATAITACPRRIGSEV